MTDKSIDSLDMDNEKNVDFEQDCSIASDFAPSGEDIASVSINSEMKRSYLDYAMSVIVSRALPDVRDGLKPVHRRILYAMHGMGLVHNKNYRKSAAVIGEVISKYHPHGDIAIYDALVRMAQDFSMREPLVDGQGNYGSIDADPAAAMRYTECRLEKISQTLMLDIDKDTVNFQENYDGRELEPVVLPSRFPNLLVNGSGGIAVGMATNIPPHNLGEVLDGCIALINDPSISLDEMMEIIPGPDFPTGAEILGRSGIRSAYESGRGSIIVRAKTYIEDIGDNRQAIIATEIPYQVNKRTMIEKISELIKDKRIDTISTVRDESDREGYRVVIELKRGAVAQVVLNQLYKLTPLQASFGCNMVALNGGQPQQLGLLEILRCFVSFREEVVLRRTKYLLNKARDRAHLLVGLAIAVANIDEVIRIIKTAPDPQTARIQLMTRNWAAGDVAPLIKLVDDPRHIIKSDMTYNLSEDQARAILELRLQRLTALGRDEIADELNVIGNEIKGYLELLSSRDKILSVVKTEMLELREELATPRRTSFAVGDFDIEDEDLIAKEDMVVTVSHTGYIKRVSLDSYREQRRGGRGRSGMATKDDDFVTNLFVANTHTWLLFFSSKGKVYKEKVWRLPLSNPQSRGKALVNHLPLEEDERITTIIRLPEDEKTWNDTYLVFVTTKATVRRSMLRDVIPSNRNGKIAMRLGADDSILAVESCTVNDDILLISAKGQCVRFSVDKLRVTKGLDSMGVRGISLKDEDKVISLAILSHIDASSEERIAYIKRASFLRKNNEDNEVISDSFDISNERFEELQKAEQLVLIVSEGGYGKRVSSYEFATTNRGNLGVRATDVSKLDQTGKLIGAFVVASGDSIILGSGSGQIIRVPVDDISIFGRATKGVKIFRTSPGELVVSAEVVKDSDEETKIDEVGDN